MSHIPNNQVVPSQQYILSLGGYLTCPKRGCSGKLIPVLVRYYRQSNEKIQSEIVEELECTCCGKVIKDERQLFKTRVKDNHIKEEDPMAVLKSSVFKKQRRRK